MLAIIGIPIYKEELTSFEEISLQQVNYVMRTWKKVFIAPKSLLFNYGNDYDYEVVRFDDKYFKSTSSYSQLLLTKEFYNRFSEYEYLLIYQLDAFVFSDKLKEFCGLGYDYIGAPAKGGNWSKYHVGNGGFSLRNIQQCLSVLNNKSTIIKKMISQNKPENWGEDDFFAFCGWVKDIEFKVPSPKLAATFSAQTDYVRGLRDISSRGLPFGCHYWTTVNYHFWKPYIEKYGYILSDNQIEKSTNTLVADYVIRIGYLIKRCIRKKSNSGMIFNDVFLTHSVYSIWGAGKLGKRCIELIGMVFKSFRIKHVYDEYLHGTCVENIKVERPNISEIKNDDSVLVIATTRFQYQIRKKLLVCGMEEGRDFIILPMFYEKIYKALNSMI